MKSLVNLILVLFLTINVLAQETKVKLTVDVSNNFMNCFTTSRYFNLSTVGIGVNLKAPQSNIRLLISYGFNTYIANLSDTAIYYAESFALKSHLVGLTLESIFLREERKFRPFLGISFLSELATNYRNGYIVKDLYFPYKGFDPPIVATYYQGHGIPDKVIYGRTLYQATPLLVSLFGGCTIKLIKELNLNLSLGYNLSLLRYKRVEWEYDTYKKENYQEKLKIAPIQTKTLHSITFQLGINYTFSFKKKLKTETP